MMAPTAAYGEMADWYEQEFLRRTAAAVAEWLMVVMGAPPHAR